MDACGTRLLTAGIWPDGRPAWGDRMRPLTTSCLGLACRVFIAERVIRALGPLLARGATLLAGSEALAFERIERQSQRGADVIERWLRRCFEVDTAALVSRADVVAVSRMRDVSHDGFVRTVQQPVVSRRPLPSLDHSAHGLNLGERWRGRKCGVSRPIHTYVPNRRGR